MSFFENTRKPKGFGGKIMVAMMNSGHAGMANWGLQFLDIPENADILDCGCGGGANIKRLLEKCKNGTVKGIDYSEISVEKSRKVNDKAIKNGRCEILQANVLRLPFEQDSFDIVTAFETIYFWPDLQQSFRQIYSVLKSSGTFFICNESNGDTNKDDKWVEKIGGMTIYNDTQIKNILEQTGFSHIQIEKNEKGWICVIAEK